MIFEKTRERPVTYQDICHKNRGASGVETLDWKDYKWQLNNSIKTIVDFENFTGIIFTEQRKQLLEKTIEKFPLCITPYYASLIDPENYP